MNIVWIYYKGKQLPCYKTESSSRKKSGNVTNVCKSIIRKSLIEGNKNLHKRDPFQFFRNKECDSLK